MNFTEVSMLLYQIRNLLVLIAHQQGASDEMVKKALSN